MTDLGEVTRCYSVRFERRSTQSPQRLWRAITDDGEVSKWMTYPARIDLRIGGDYFIDFGRTGEGELAGVIVKIVPGQLLRYAWDTSVIEWEIEAMDGGSRYTFAHYGLQDRGLPDEEGLIAGWHAWLDDLGRFVDDGAVATDHAPGWRSLDPLYRPILSEVLGGLRSDSPS